MELSLTFGFRHFVLNVHLDSRDIPFFLWNGPNIILQLLISFATDDNQFFLGSVDRFPFKAAKIVQKA